MARSGVRHLRRDDLDGVRRRLDDDRAGDRSRLLDPHPRGHEHGRTARRGESHRDDVLCADAAAEHRVRGVRARARVLPGRAAVGRAGDLAAIADPARPRPGLQRGLERPRDNAVAAPDGDRRRVRRRRRAVHAGARGPARARPPAGGAHHGRGPDRV